MENRDYLKDQIEQFGRVLRALLERLKIGNSVEAVESVKTEFENEFTNTFGFSTDELDHDKKEDIQLNDHQLFLIAQLYKEFSVHQKEPAKAKEWLLKTLKIMEIAQSKAPGFSLEYQEFIDEITRLIEGIE